MKRKRKWVGEKQEKKYEAWIKKRRKGRGRVISGKKLDIGNKRKRLTKGRDGEDEPQKIQESGRSDRKKRKKQRRRQYSIEKVNEKRVNINKEN